MTAPARGFIATVTARDAWARLAAAGLVHGAMPAPDADAPPWYVSAMLGLAAWLAALCLLAFAGIALSGVLRNATGALVAGALVCMAAVVALRRAGNGIFATQLAIAVSLAGQALVGVGLLGGSGRGTLEWAAVAGFEVVLVALAPHPLHRVLATLAAAVALRFCLGSLGFAVLFPAVVAVVFVAVQGRTAARLARDALWGPVSLGLALALPLVLPLAMLDDVFAFDRDAVPWAGVTAAAGTATVALAFLLSAARLLHEAGVGATSRNGAAAFLACAMVAVAAWPVPGVVVALIVLLEAFAAGRRPLAGVAVVALAAALVHYYYVLPAPLLAKAAALAATGVVLLGARWGLAQLAVAQASDHA